MSELQVVSFSEADTAKQCPLKHQLTYIERWTNTNVDPLGALSKGSAWHRVMEVHYLELQKLQKAPNTEVATLRKCAVVVEETIEREILPSSMDLADLVWWMYVGYVHQHGRDERWKILAVEHAAQCRLPTPAGRPSGFMLKMKIDLVVSTQPVTGKPQMWVVDHKSCKDLPKGKELDLDDQFGLYTWGLRKMGRPVFGQVHNAARTTRLKGEEAFWASNGRGQAQGPTSYAPDEVQLNADRFLRSPMYRTDAELDEVAVETYQVMRARYTEQQRADRAGTDSPRHTNPDSCRWRCNYLDACIMGRKSGGVQMREFLIAKGFRQDFDRH